MLEDAAGIRRVVLACGTVDLRKGIDGLATIIGDKYGQKSIREGYTLFVLREGYPGQGIRRKQRSLPKNSTSTS